MRIEGKSAVDAKGVQHVTEQPGMSLCGATVVAYPLHWDTRTAIHCAECIGLAVALREGE